MRFAIPFLVFVCVTCGTSPLQHEELLPVTSSEQILGRWQTFGETLELKKTGQFWRFQLNTRWMGKWDVEEGKLVLWDVYRSFYPNYSNWREYSLGAWPVPISLAPNGRTLYIENVAYFRL